MSTSKFGAFTRWKRTIDSELFFLTSLGQEELPSEPTLRQRMDPLAESSLTLVKQASWGFLANVRPNSSVVRLNRQVDFVIKWNPRREDPAKWARYADAHSHWEDVREGKRVSVFSIDHGRDWKGHTYTIRRVM